ncbi:MAG: tetratricopeptide repeat protein [candidate division Zixibacteria bacterium]|nr:tetratricopeptide repeat protein [candidate division Zixibacteria bacterium]
MIRVSGLLITVMFYVSVSYGQTRSVPGQIPGAGVSVPSPFSQRSTPEEDAAQARKLEQTGRIEQAIILYERALQKSPTQAQALNALPRLYIQTQRYDRAIALLGEQVRRSTNNTVFRRQMAETLFQAKRTDEASAQLQEIVARNPEEEGTLRMVAALYTTYGQYQDAIRTYTEGRRAIGKPDVFAEALAGLHTTLSDIPGAVSEYTRLLNAQPDRFAVIDDHIDALTYIRTPETVEQALLAAASVYANRKDIHRLVGNFYFRQEKPTDALAFYRKADQADDAKGTLLLEFVRRAADDGYYTEAAEACTMLRNPSLPNTVQPQASLYLARMYQETGRMEEAAAVYREIGMRFSRSRENEEAQFYLAELELVFRHNPQIALNGFRGLLTTAPRTTFREAALFRIADCHVARNSVRDAIDQYNRILDPGTGLTEPSAQARARFHLAEMELFREQIDEAVKQFTAVAEAFPNSRYANDALRWSLLLSEIKQDGNEATHAYVQAVLLRRQFKPQEALDGFKSLLSQFPETAVGDMVILEIGSLFDELGKPYEAIAAYRDLIQRYPASQYAPDTHRRIAELYETRLGDIPGAIAEYETAIVQYPDYFQNDAIRRKIRELSHRHIPRP